MSKAATSTGTVSGLGGGGGFWLRCTIPRPIHCAIASTSTSARASTSGADAPRAVRRASGRAMARWHEGQRIVDMAVPRRGCVFLTLVYPSLAAVQAKTPRGRPAGDLGDRDDAGPREAHQAAEQERC